MKSIQDFTPEDALKELKHSGSIHYHLSTYTHTYIITFHTEDCLRTFSKQTVIKHEPNAEEAINSIKKEFGNEVKVVIDFIYME